MRLSRIGIGAVLLGLCVVQGTRAGEVRRLSVQEYVDKMKAGWIGQINLAGRNLMRKGIAPPDSGHPQFNKHADDIDYQIEADFSGLIAPGMPQLVIELGDKFGRLMNYGDGVYAGQFVGGLYAEAFFETDIRRPVMRALCEQRVLTRSTPPSHVHRAHSAWPPEYHSRSAV